MAFRRLSLALTTDLEENDDDTEKEERRSRFSSASTSSNVSTSVVSLCEEELKIQIQQCLKLSAENKISHQNAFQLKMIDFLLFALKKQNPQMDSLQMASACLDASGKIYGFRVDKVHSDLLKIISGTRGEKRAHAEESQDANGILQLRKKRKKKQVSLCTPDALRGNIEIYNPLSAINSHDKQTSDCLFQASLPKHMNLGISLNLYNDVVLDKVSLNRYSSSNFLITKIEDFTREDLCPSYAAFNFLGWCVNNESIDNDSDGGEYHFNIDESIVDDKSSNMMDYRDNEEKFGEVTQADQDQQPLNDYQNIIENDPPDSNVSEYSYIQENLSIKLVRPSYWRVHKKDARFNEAPRTGKRKKRKKDIELEMSEENKEEAKTSYITNDRVVKLCDENAKIENKEDIRGSHDDIFNLSNFENCRHNNEDRDLQLDEQEDQVLDTSFMCSDTEPPLHPQYQEPLLGQNLIPLPKITEKIFIPYSQKAKKIDMRQLKKNLKTILKNCDTKDFSELYKELPAKLSSVMEKSLSPALAFMSLLHVSHENTLHLENHTNFTDLTIKKL